VVLGDWEKPAGLLFWRCKGIWPAGPNSKHLLKVKKPNRKIEKRNHSDGPA
jgi:hypothetical protein